MPRFIWFALVVALGVAAGCRGSAGITGTPAPAEPLIALEGVPESLPEIDAAALERIAAAQSKANVALPRTCLKFPCNILFQMASYRQPGGGRIDFIKNICGDFFYRLTDATGNVRWEDWWGNPIPRP